MSLRTRRSRDLTGQRVVITGASDGIGRALALSLATSGAELILLARREEQLHQVATEIAQRGGSASCVPVDLADREATEQAIRAVLDEHGGVDLLVNNAGRSIRRTVAESYDRLHDTERTIRLNYFGAVHLILAFLPGMRDRRNGHIINVSSMATQDVAPRFAAYNGSKAALDHWSQTVASEVRADNVQVSTVYMPLIATRMSAATLVYDPQQLGSPEQAAQLLMQAINTRRARIATHKGTIGQIVAACAPDLHRRGLAATEGGARRARVAQTR